MKRFLTVLLILIFLFSCASGVPIQTPRYSTSAQRDTLTRTMEGKKRIGVVSRQPPPMRGMEMSGSQFAATVEAKVKAAIQERGYFEVSNLDDRADMLREQAYSQTGLTTSQLAIGRQLAVNGLLMVRLTTPPLTECRVEMRNDATAAALQLGLALATDGKSGGKTEEIKKPVPVRYLTINVEGRLVNTETGRQMAAVHTTPYKLEGDFGGVDCPSVLDAFDKALEVAAEELSSKLSPKMTTQYIPVSESVDDLPSDRRDQVAQFLKQGNEWAEDGDMDMAAESWKRALDMSGGQSKAASWNLAAFNWYKGNMDEADRLFQRSMSMANPDFVDRAKRQVWKLFKDEKERKAGEEDD